MQRDDHTLLIAMRRGEHAAAAALWSRYAARLTAYARAIVGHTDAEDAVQDAMLRALDSDHATITAVRDVPAWLATLVRRAALNRLREARRRRSREEHAAQRTPPPQRNQDHEALAARVAALPRRLREVVILRHVCGLTFAQCAAALGANANTVASRYREATDSLRAGAARPDTQPRTVFAPRQEVVHG